MGQTYMQGRRTCGDRRACGTDARAGRAVTGGARNGALVHLRGDLDGKPLVCAVCCMLSVHRDGGSPTTPWSNLYIPIPTDPDTNRIPDTNSTRYIRPASLRAVIYIACGVLRG